MTPKYCFFVSLASLITELHNDSWIFGGFAVTLNEYLMDKMK